MSTKLRSRYQFPVQLTAAAEAAAALELRILKCDLERGSARVLTLTSVSRYIANLHGRARSGLLVPGTLLLSAMLGSGSIQAEEIYRWVDADGVVNYTQQKPRDVAAESLITQRGAPTRVRSSSARSSDPSARTDTDGTEQPMTDAQQRMLEELKAKEQARQQEVAEIREQNCSKSRRVLSDLSAKERIRVRDDNGQERIMPEDERQRRISDAQKGIVENCDASA
jgi:hypothetical protein